MIGMSRVLSWADPNPYYRQCLQIPFETFQPVYEKRFERREDFPGLETAFINPRTSHHPEFRRIDKDQPQR
jgi:hypothetical protein